MSAVPKMHAQLRALGWRDIDALMAIEVRAYSFPWTRGNFVDALAAGYLGEVLEQHPLGETHLLGYFVAMAGVDELHLLNITVAPELQGLGHGAHLLQAVHQRARALGLSRVLLEVRASNLRAQALYRRHGYTEIGMRRGYYPAATGREDALVMQWTTSAADRSAT